MFVAQGADVPREQVDRTRSPRSGYSCGQECVSVDNSRPPEDADGRVPQEPFHILALLDPSTGWTKR